VNGIQPGGFLNIHEYTLQYPVYTFDGTIVLPAGTVLTEEVLSDVMISGRNKSKPVFLKLLDFGTVREDIREFLSSPPYNAIFSEWERTRMVMEIMDSVEVMESVMESLMFFRDNDFYTYRHMMLVFALSILLSQELLKDNNDWTAGAKASPAHDFGKICIPVDILKKSIPISREDRKRIEHHTLAGYILLTYYMHDMAGLAPRIARDHHERLNGSGYPLGVKQQDPMIEIIVVSDVYDALISPRPYRPQSYDNRTALEEICSKAEKGKLRWDVVKALIACNRKNKPHYTACTVSTEKRGAPPTHNVYGIIAD
jgi:HD-GYP domain-containing protein (c-di-GMP phosphodiesterase class II)